AGFGPPPFLVSSPAHPGTLTLFFLNVKADRLARLFPVGAERVVSGRVEFYGGMPQIAHPDLVLRPDELDRLKPIEPVYPLTAGLSPRLVQRAAGAALERLPTLPGGIGPAVPAQRGLAGRGWPGWGEAVRQAHAPESEADLSPMTPARQRLAYDEIFASQLAVGLARARRHRQKGRAIIGTGALVGRVEAALGFALTGAQRL